MIPSFVVGVAATIAIIFVWALQKSNNPNFNAAMPAIASCSLGLALGLGMTYLARKEKRLQ